MDKNRSDAGFFLLRIGYCKFTLIRRKRFKLLLLLIIFQIFAVWIIFGSSWTNLLAKYISNVHYCSTKIHLETLSPKTGGFEEIAPGTLIYSAYFDNITGSPFIRLVAVTETFKPPKIFCHFTNQTPDAQVHLVDENKRRKYAAFVVSCELPKSLHQVVPKTVSVSVEHDSKGCIEFTFRVDFTANNNNVKEYAVCVPPLWGKELTLTNFIEFIELNRILGASEFFLYNEDMNEEILKAAKTYESLGVVNLMPWNLPRYINNFHGIHYHGQLAAIQDCLFRTRGKAKWVGFHDFDEFLVPLKKPTIPSLVKGAYDRNASGYCLQSIILPKKTVITAEDLANNTLITQKFLFRTGDLFPRKIRSKCIINPMKVSEMRIHEIKRPVFAKDFDKWLSPDEALVFHYRNFDGGKVVCRQDVSELKFMLKFKNELTNKVEEMLQFIDGL